MEYRYRIIYIDDGSRDNTLTILKEIAQVESFVQVIELSRNFGHQAALSAGLSIANGNYVIMMDGDGQHPGSLIPEMIAFAEQGYDIVLTSRVDQKSLGMVKRVTSKLFYTIVNVIFTTKLEPSSADFRLLNAAAVSALRNMPEYHRFLRGMVAWIGFKLPVILSRLVIVSLEYLNILCGKCCG